MYDMKLLEGRYIEGIRQYIIRVPGGWIFYPADSLLRIIGTGVFVPYHNEFQGELKSRTENE